MKKQRLLNRNEVIYGPSSAVARAIRHFDVRKAPFYFDGYYGSLLAPELSRKFGLSIDQISVGYGIEFFLRAVFDACDSRRDIVLTNALHYGYYSVYAKAKQVRLATFRLIDRESNVPGAREFVFDIAACITKIKKLRPKVVLITSPNNPTGNSISLRDVANVIRAAKAARRDSLVVLDEAYWGFVEQYDERAVLALLKKHENLIILRGFSKRYALAGLRIGFAFWGKHGGQSAKNLIHFDDLYLGGSRLLEEIAVAALRSESYYANLSKDIIALRKNFIYRVSKLKNFTPYVSDANFFAIKIAKPALVEFKKRAAAQKGNISKFVAPRLIRVTLGFKKDVDQFIKLLELIDRDRKNK